MKQSKLTEDFDFPDMAVDTFVPLKEKPQKGHQTEVIKFMSNFDVPEDYEEIGGERDYEDFGRAEFDEEGDRVQGELVDIIDAEHGQGYIVEIDEDTARIVYPNEMLQRKLDNVNVGDEILIVFMGTKDVGKPQPMNVFNLYTK